MSHTIAIVGSGPAGSYLAQALARQAADLEITVFERLPVPYGLIRYGVAADHQGTKAVIEQFDRLFSLGRVRFAGNVEVGVDVSLQELQDAFDVVVLATGVASDRVLDIPGESESRVYGSGTITRLMNGHPDEIREGLELGRRTVIVGNGNVAMDLLRTLSKSESDFLNSDVDDALRNDLVKSLEEISVVGRSAAHLAKFDKSLVKELGRIGGLTFEMHGLGDALGDLAVIQQEKVDELRSLASLRSSGPPRMRVKFYFGWVPEVIIGEGGVTAMKFRAEGGRDERLVIPADSVITAVGFTHGDRDTFTRESLGTSDSDFNMGILAPGLYCTGWFGRGASGTIPEHRAASKYLASVIVEDLGTAPPGSTKTGFGALPYHLAKKSIGFEGWKAIDAVERAAAPDGRYRRKIVTRERLLSIASGVGADTYAESVSQWP